MEKKVWDPMLSINANGTTVFATGQKSDCFSGFRKTLGKRRKGTFFALTSLVILLLRFPFALKSLVILLLRFPFALQFGNTFIEISLVCGFLLTLLLNTRVGRFLYRNKYRLLNLDHVTVD